MTTNRITMFCPTSQPREASEPADGQLLDRFIEAQDESAFEAIVRRHGPMVLSVCRRILHNHHNAEDAFQATFLVLARKADSIRRRSVIASWLYGVAVKTSLRALSGVARRGAREKQVLEMPEPQVFPSNNDHVDLMPLLDQELQHLPAKYRLPIVLRDVEGKGYDEAARQLGWPTGTFAGRLSRARKILAARLARRQRKAASSALPIAL
jgi:RNA polymerase sigma-70 factor (ECF subfamily)